MKVSYIRETLVITALSKSKRIDYNILAIQSIYKANNLQEVSAECLLLPLLLERSEQQLLEEEESLARYGQYK